MFFYKDRINLYKNCFLNFMFYYYFKIKINEILIYVFVFISKLLR